LSGSRYPKPPALPEVSDSVLNKEMAVDLGAPWGGLRGASEAAVVAVLLFERRDTAERPMPPQRTATGFLKPL